jgi:hypothetical protein
MSRGRHRQPSPRRGLRIAGSAAAAAGIAVLSTSGIHALAAAPLKYGWWSATNAGAPITPPAPPDVPAKGLYVENGFSGATAIAALSFSVPTSAKVGALTLTTTGSPVINAAPLACPIDAKSVSYRPSEDGQWAQRPSYDCTHAVKGTVSSDKKTVTFAATSLVRAGSLAVAIVAGGTADRIPFQQPAATALTLTSAPAGSSGTTAQSGTGGGGAYSQPASPSKPQAAGAGAAAGAVSAPAPPSTGSVGAGTTSDPGVPPAVASPQASGAPVSAGGGTAAAASSSGGGGSNRLATVLGLAAVIAALVFWAEGFGVLGGRIVTLAGRRRTVPYPAEPLTETSTTPAHS